MSLHVLLGWLSFSCFMLTFGYSVFKRVLPKHIKAKISTSRMLNLHCLIAVLAVFFGFVHAGKFLGLHFSIGNICLILFIIISITGVITKYCKSVFSKCPKLFIILHIVLSILIIEAVGMHILMHYI